MIKRITVTNAMGGELELELTRPEKSGLLIASVDGLGPVKAAINITDVSTGDGGVFNSSRLDKRNIVMQLFFLPSGTESIEDIRQKTYVYFPIKKEVRLTFITDNRSVMISGYVESNEPDIFSASEGCQISIMCPDPYFYSPGTDITSFSDVKPKFFFPFFNKDVIHSTLKMGEIENRTEQVILYDGDSEIGMTIHIHALGQVKHITILNVMTGDQMFLDTERIASIMRESPGVISGDSIVISTMRGYKSISLIREGKETNILNCLKKGSTWLSLQKGINVFSYSAEEGSSNLQLYIENKIAYTGI